MISIDPGVNGSAVAYWVDGALVTVRVGENPYSTVHNIVIEKPQVYQGRKQKGDPNDLIDLAIVVGQWIRGHEAVLVKPREWKGQVPKDIMKKRIMSKLSADERERLGDLHKDHNAVDAVGIGLWKLGRL